MKKLCLALSGALWVLAFLILSVDLEAKASASQSTVNGNPRLATGEYMLCGKSLVLEEARSEQQRQLGLMHRDGIKEGEGMIFVFDRLEPLSFWMRNVSFDIKIAFIDTQGKLINTHLMKGSSPLVRDSALPQYTSTRPAKYAVEVRTDFFDDIENKSLCRLEPLP